MALIVASLLHAPALSAAEKLTNLLGHPVVTDGGDRLGNIEDFAVDPTTGSLDYIVISIGSFLVEKSLIAVEADALGSIRGDEPLVVRMDDLEVAHRFNADNWPESADVRAIRSSASGATTETEDPASASVATLSQSGSATIVSGRKKATYDNGKRELINGPLRRAPRATTTASASTTPREPRVIPNFKNLDRNRDGRLSRAEIGAEMSQRTGFKDLDIDANGSIDDFEYEAYRERLATQRRWVGNR